jgi:hypothetical protein
MNEEPVEAAQAEWHISEDAHGKPGSLWILWSLIGLLLAYPLSLGPVVKYYKSRHPPEAVYAFYRPLKLLAEKVPAIEKPFLWYLDLWGAK